MPDQPEPPDRPAAPPVRPPAQPMPAVQRWRLVLGREPLQREAGQREQQSAWEEALAASGLPVAGLDAVPPRPRFTPAAPLAASLRGEAELADVWLTRRLPAWEVRAALGTAVPRGYRLVDAYDVWLGAPALPGQVVASVYRVTVGARAAVDADSLRRAVAALLAMDALPREREKGTGTIRYDLRPFLDGISVSGSVDPGGAAVIVLRLTLRHDPEKGIGRPEEALAALAEEAGVVLGGAVIVRESLVLAPPPPPVPATRARRPGQPSPAASARRPRK